MPRLLPDGLVTGAGSWKLWIQGPYRGGPSLIASGTTENGGATPLAWARRGGNVAITGRP